MPLAIILLIGCLWSAPAMAQIESHGVNFSERLLLVDSEMQLTGTALLKWALFFDVYVGAFYLPAQQPAERWSDDGPKILELVYLREISADDFTRSSDKLLRENLSQEQYQQLGERLVELYRLFRDVQTGDRYTLAYHPETGTELRFNGDPLGRIPGHDFAQAYFSIWLGSRPISVTFRDQLLGG